MNIIAALVRPRTEADDNSFVKRSLDDGVMCLKGMVDGQEMPFEYFFDMELFDMQAAQAWLVANDAPPVKEWFQIDKPDIQEPTNEPQEPTEEDNLKKDKDEKSLYVTSGFSQTDLADERFQLDAVEILRAGTWNGTKFTIEDLDEIVKSFDETKDDLNPFVKLGHDEKQAFLQSDGLPAAGWITALKREGQKLIATVKNIPKKVFDLIKTGAYRNVSSEIMFDASIKGKKHRRLLKAIALLGADTPAVNGMNDLVDTYLSDELAKTKVINLKTNEKEVEEMELKEQVENLTKEAKSLKDDNAALVEKLSRLEDDRKQERVQNFIEAQIKLGKILPAQADAYTVLLLDNSVKKFSYKEGDKLETKDVTNLDLVNDILKSSSVKVDLSTQSQDIEPDRKKKSEVEGVELHEKTLAYAKENKLSYGEAYSEVIRG